MQPESAPIHNQPFPCRVRECRACAPKPSTCRGLCRPLSRSSSAALVEPIRSRAAQDIRMQRCSRCAATTVVPRRSGTVHPMERDLPTYRPLPRDRCMCPVSYAQDILCRQLSSISREIPRRSTYSYSSP
jgi:hypothetical protein